MNAQSESRKRSEQEGGEASEWTNEGYSVFSDIPYTAVQMMQDQGQGDDEGVATFTFDGGTISNGANHEGDEWDFDDETQPREEVFFAHTGASVGDNDDGKEISNDDYDESVNKCQEMDFQTLADQALKSLNLEYAQAQTVCHNQECPGLPVGTTVGACSEPGDVDENDENSSDTCESVEREVAAVAIVEQAELSNTNATEKLTSTSTTLPKANTKTIQGIQFKNTLLTSKLNSKLQNWKPSHADYTPLIIPESHPLIPSKTLLAFRRFTAKAKAASKNLSRSATLAEAVKRLFIDCNGIDNGEKDGGDHSKYDNQSIQNVQSKYDFCRHDDIFVIHCIGADHVECQSKETISRALSPFIRWFHQYNHFEDGINCNNDKVHHGESWPMHMRIELLGPNVPPHAEKFGAINLLPDSMPGRLASATVLCKNCLYHDYITDLEKEGKEKLEDDRRQQLRQQRESNLFPNLVIVYNAGIWGYTDWHPTLRQLYRIGRPVPFVITAYTLPEAEDDTEAMEEVLSVKLTNSNNNRCLWKAEMNPYASRVERATSSSDNTYYENGAWQAYLMGQI